MPESFQKIEQTLQQLGVGSEEQVSALFVEIRQKFNEQEAHRRKENDPVNLQQFWTIWLGRKSGVLTKITENWLKPSPPELKRIVGQELNSLKAHVEAVRTDQRTALESAADQTALTREREDLSLPGVMRPVGSRHPLRQTFEEIERIFLSLGYTVVSGPEMETPYYNFEALNIPEHHPARDNMDTFYMATPPGASPLLLRTHTSPMQIRTMEKQQPPVRIIVPGKVYRRDNPDATHGFAFHQIEGLAVDTDITFCDFTGAIEYFVQQFFGPGVKTRFRPSYFPFTEPSVEFDVSCPFCGGTGTASGGGTCSKCKGAAWIELFGAGMVDPAMLKYGTDDIQVFFQNDVRFLRQFP